MKIGSLFSGYGGLDMAVSSVTGARTVWHSDIDPGASKILAHHWPDVPNHGDLTKIDWSQVEPVDILTGGFPCQDLSHAGKRAGLKPGTRSGLWSHMAYAINQLRPSLVVFENVRGILSASAASDLEPCPWCLGDDEGGSLRALGSVWGDLAELGYDGAWCGLRAADVGAPHGRFRVFGVAWPAADAHRVGLNRAGAARVGRHGPANGGLLPTPRATRGGSSTETVGLLPTPRATDGTKGGPNQRGSSGDLMLPSAVALLPTPAVNDMGEGKTPQAWDEWTARMKAAHGNGNGHGASLAIEAQRLLPTPTVEDREASGGGYNGQTNVTLTDATVRQPELWGDYAAAILRWQWLTRPAPAPTERDWDRWRKRKLARIRSRKPVGMRGSLRFMVDGPTAQLSPAFSEWLMGLPAGHVTAVPGLTRAQQLKALGNGVVPHQAAAALEHLLALIPQERAA